MRCFNMENVGIGFYISLLIHHATVEIVASYQMLSIAVEDKSIKVVEQYTFRFLTIWNMVLQTSYLSLSIICYVLDRVQVERCKNFARKLGIILKFINVSIMSPLAIFIVLLFWLVYTIDRECIYPTVLDNFISVWTNYSMHAIIIVLPLVEIFLQRGIRMPIFKHSLLVLTAFLITYGCLLFGTYFIDGVWLYAFIEKCPWPGRILFVFVSYVACISLLTLTTTIHKSVFSRSRLRD